MVALMVKIVKNRSQIEMVELMVKIVVELMVISAPDRDGQNREEPVKVQINFDCMFSLK